MTESKTFIVKSRLVSAMTVLALFVTPLASSAQEAQLAQHAMIASNSEVASRAGIEVMRRGGNAVDGAVAVGFALAVAYPEAGNLGGGGYMMIHLSDGRSAAIDFREMAPAAATRDMFISNGKPDKRSTIGYTASGVPGSVAGLCAAQKKYGKLSLGDVMAPAIAMAENGYVVDSMTYRSLVEARSLIAQFEGAPLFFPNGALPAIGSTIKQPALAKTLRAIAAQGPDGFYRGAVAEAIASDMKAHGGIITASDLAGYRVEWRAPLKSTFGPYTLMTMPPSSSGGITMTETMNILAGYPTMPAFGSAEYVARLGAAFQRAFIDRNGRLGDPAFVKLPIAELTKPSYAARVRGTIHDQHTPTSELVKPMDAALREGMQTTHYSVMDSDGNAVATTTTLNELYGSGVYIPAVGIFMNDEMDDFTVQIGAPNGFGLVQGESNSIAPHKRMLSAMSPTIVLDQAGKPMLVIGARGGPRIITATTQVTLNVLKNHMSLADAMNAPRIHHQALPDEIFYMQGAITPSVADSLRARGWTIRPTSGVAEVDAVMRTKEGLWGMDDPHNRAKAVGY